jgi:hypothetical protein
MKSLKVLTFLGALGLSFIVGCGGGGGSSTPVTPSPTSGSKVDIGGLSYYLPTGVQAIGGTIVGTNAKMLASENGQKVAGFIQEIAGSSSGKSNGSAFSKVQATIAEVEVAVRDANYTHSISMLSTQNLTSPYPFTITQYSLVTKTNIQPLELAGNILSTIAGGGVTGLPFADVAAPSETEFRFFLLSGVYNGVTFYLAVVVPERLYSEYEILINTILNAASIKELNGVLQAKTDTFTTGTAKSKADFLFVIDDSGSMSDDQDAVAKAAKDFTGVMKTSGVSYRMAIITTGDGAGESVDNSSYYNSAYYALKTYGIIENDDALFEKAILVGDNGSYTETGIWNAEQALQSNGAITLAGMPQAGASLSVVIISDEPSQYTSRSGGIEFDVNKNLFLDRGIKVYSIISPSYNYETTGLFDEYNESQYDDLSMATQGMYSDIRNTNTNGVLDYSVIMGQIAKDATGVSSSFVLASQAASITEVKVDGVVVAANTQNGYSYNQASNSIVFHGTAIPTGGKTVTVTYKY